VEDIIFNMSTPHNLQCQSMLAVSIRRDLLSFVHILLNDGSTTSQNVEAVTNLSNSVTSSSSSLEVR